MADYDYDLFTIGAGSGGVRAARLAGKMGKRSALAEEWTVGGTCVHRGCIPKKFYVYASHFADDFEDARAFGWDVEVKGFDWPRLVAAKKKELERLGGLYDKGLSDAGVTVLRARAMLEDAHTVNIGGKLVTAENILIATGGRPNIPDIPGAEHVITSDDIFDLPQLPGRVVIEGAGFIALEFACILKGLGSDVTVVYRRTGVLRGFDDDIRTGDDVLDDRLRRRFGVRRLLEADGLHPGRLDQGLERVHEFVRALLRNGEQSDGLAGKVRRRRAAFAQNRGGLRRRIAHRIVGHGHASFRVRARRG